MSTSNRTNKPTVAGATEGQRQFIDAVKQHSHDISALNRAGWRSVEAEGIWKEAGGHYQVAQTDFERLPAHLRERLADKLGAYGALVDGEHTLLSLGRRSSLRVEVAPGLWVDRESEAPAVLGASTGDELLQALRMRWAAALDREPLRSQIADPVGHVLKLPRSVVERLPKDLAVNLERENTSETALKALQEALNARGIPLSAPAADDLEEGAHHLLSDDTVLIERTDAYYARRTLPAGGRKEWPVLARPFKLEKWLTVEGEIRVVMEDQGGRFAGTFGDAARRLKENGQVLDPKYGDRALTRLKADAPFAGDAPATFGLAEEASGELFIPTEFYPRPGHQADAVRDVTANENVALQPEDWSAWRAFFGFYHAREWMPLAGLAAIAPAALILRSERVLVPASYAYSRAGGTGKTTLSAALSSQLYGLEPLSGEGVNSDFRFLGMLNAACLPRLIDEAERLKWDRQGALLKAAMHSPHASDRGNKDRTVEVYRSRAVPFFTSNARPPFSRPVLARFFMLPFDEGREVAQETAQVFQRAVERLTPAGRALAAALVKIHPTKAALLARHKSLSEALGKARDRWDDSRRPGAWAVAYLGLEAWAEASAGAVEVPTIEVFVRDVVEPVERATFEEPLDALETLRGWLAGWAQRNASLDRPSGLTGPARLEVRDATRLAGMRALEARYVTKALLDIYSRDQVERTEIQFSGLGDVAREVQRQYGVAPEDLLDGAGKPKIRVMADGTRLRAVPLPLEAPGTPAPTEAEA